MDPDLILSCKFWFRRKKCCVANLLMTKILWYVEIRGNLVDGAKKTDYSHVNACCIAMVSYIGSDDRRSTRI